MEGKKEENKGVARFAKKIGEATKQTFSNVSQGLKSGSQTLSQQIGKAIYENDRKRLNPIFQDELLSEEFAIPSIINVVDYNMRKDNKACEGAVGFMTYTAEVRILNIYLENADLLQKKFYPQLRVATYYVDPCHSDLYIEIEEYFSYMKKVRVDELELVAQSLGAKHFKVALKVMEQKKSNVSLQANGKSVVAKGEVSVTSSANDFLSVSVAAEIDFVGSDQPKKPELTYFKEDNNIRSLIEMRMDKERGNGIKSKTYQIEYGHSSGIKMNESARIGTALKKIDCSFANEFMNTADRENRTILEYTIVF